MTVIPEGPRSHSRRDKWMEKHDWEATPVTDVDVPGPSRGRSRSRARSEQTRPRSRSARSQTPHPVASAAPRSALRKRDPSRATDTRRVRMRTYTSPEGTSTHFQFDCVELPLTTNVLRLKNIVAAALSRTLESLDSYTQELARTAGPLETMRPDVENALMEMWTTVADVRNLFAEQRQVDVSVLLRRVVHPGFGLAVQAGQPKLMRCLQDLLTQASEWTRVSQYM